MTNGVAVISTIVLLVATGCDLLGDDGDRAPRVRLENQADHSGVLITLGDSLIVAVTDSLGRFSLDLLADGRYAVQASYPYFEKVTHTVKVENGEVAEEFDLELPQQIRFATYPQDTTLSAEHDADESRTSYWFQFGAAYAKNLTDSELRLGTTTGQKQWSLIPLDTPWPLEECGAEELVYPEVTGKPTLARIPPRDSIFIGQSFILGKHCFAPGTYLLTYLIIDTGNHPLFFREFRLDSELERKLRQSFQRKKELFNPVVVRLRS